MSKKKKKKMDLMGKVETAEKKYSKERTTPQILQALSDVICNAFDFLEIEDSALYIYDDDHFKPFTVSFAERFLMDLFKKNGICYALRPSEYRDIIRLIKGKTKDVRRQEECKTSQHKILFSDGVFNVKDRSMSRPCREDHMFSKIDYELGWGEECEPTAEARGFIQRFCNGDPIKEDYLWELIGYSLSGYRKKIIIAFWGPGGSGKSTLANMIRRICGPSACVSIGIRELSGPFKIAELQGKRLCIDSDMDATVLTPKDIGILKKLTGNDLVLGERKYEHPFYFQNQAKFLLCMNDRIRIDTDEETKPFIDRFRVFRLDSAIPEGEQKEDMDEILDENRRYFLQQAMRGLIRLVDNDFRFSCCGSDRKYIENVHRKGKDAGIEEFVLTRCRLEEGCREAFSDLYAAYRTFVTGSGYDAVSTKYFSQVLSSEYGLERSRTSSERSIHGIELKDA